VLPQSNALSGRRVDDAKKQHEKLPMRMTSIGLFFLSPPVRI